ncbi:hypothetical protein GCM10009749_17270 [Agromyces neolithicus]|uniref:Lipoprotein n=1 Tax=Agromyces neolithicus TaxID=269420 RepID=A0ABN2M4E5_9MICO
MVAVFAMSGCTASDCSDEASATVMVRSVTPDVVTVQCWSGCVDGARELTKSSGEDVWAAELATDQPESVTLAARDASGGLRFAQRFHLEWSGCPATPNPDVLELLRPEGGTAGTGATDGTGD